MGDPPRLLEGDDTLGLTRLLISSAQSEEPRDGALQRTLTSLGIGGAAFGAAAASVTAKAGTAVTSSSGAAVGGSAAASGASAGAMGAGATGGGAALATKTLATAGVAKWVSVMVIGGAMAFGAAHQLGVFAPAREALPSVSPTPPAAPAGNVPASGEAVPEPTATEPAVTEPTVTEPAVTARKTDARGEPPAVAPAVEAPASETTLGATPAPVALPVRSARRTESVTGPLRVTTPVVASQPGSHFAGNDSVSRSANGADTTSPPLEASIVDPTPPQRVEAPKAIVPSQPFELAQEVAILDRAREALASRPSSALSEVQGYLAAFPSGHLLPEALFLKMEALRGLGRDDAARAVASRLLSVAPSSPQALRARQLIATKP